MNLKELYPNIKYNNINIKGITDNSRNVKKDYIFIAIKGNKHNGNNFIDEAIKNGACFIVSEKKLFKKIPHIRVPNAKTEYVRLLQLYYHYNKDIYTIGVTGTDGKTTVSTILNNILNIQRASAYIGTNGINYLNKKIKIRHTTPTPDVFYEAYNIFKKHNINDIVMEVSSEGIIDGRIEKINFNGAIFTNLSHEHLNTHKTLEHYFMAKAKLFKNLNRDCLSVINNDDFYSAELAGYTKAKVVTYGIFGGTYQAKGIKLDFNYSNFDVYYKGIFLEHFKLPLFGRYNIYNALACIAYTNELGIDLKYIKRGIEEIKQIDGRFMNFRNQNNITGIVDFAHTPNSLQNLLDNLNYFKKGNIILILGAAGEKDKSKRTKMGNVAVDYADITIFTSEDPKNENLFNILYDLTSNLRDKEYYITLSRLEAIKLAVSIAKPNDMIVITGKGNECCEHILNYSFKHNDYYILKKALNDV